MSKTPTTTMLQFLIAAAFSFAAFIGLAWYWVIAYPMKFMDPEYAMWKAKADMAEQCDVGKLIILGDSKSVASLIPARIGPEVRNFAIGGGMTIEALAISKRIFLCPHPPQAVILSMKFSRFCHTDMYWKRMAYFGLLHFNWQDKRNLRAKATQAKDRSLIGPPTPFDMEIRLKELLYSIKFPSYYFAAMLNAGLYARENVNQTFYDDTRGQLGQHDFGGGPGYWNKDPDIEVDHFNPSPFCTGLFADLLEFYNQRHIPVYYIASPYNEIDISQINPQLVRDFRHFLEQFAARYPNFHVVGPLFPALPPEVFTDPSHVNPTGAEIWSGIFSDILTRANIAH